MYIACEVCKVEFDYNLQDEVNHCIIYARKWNVTISTIIFIFIFFLSNHLPWANAFLDSVFSFAKRKHIKTKEAFLSLQHVSIIYFEL